jgi:hypothetical protein
MSQPNETLSDIGGKGFTMVMCQFCMGERADGISCTNAPMLFFGKVFEPVRWGAEKRNQCPAAISECVGCHTPPGGFHHHGGLLPV